jgi:hypothetical protein
LSLPERLARSVPARLGPVAQAAIPAVYAWGVTLAPFLFAPALELVVVSVLPLAAIALSLYLEQQRRPYAIHVLLWGYAGPSTLALLIAPQRALHRFDWLRGALGILGYALFAYTVAAPALRAPSTESSAPRPHRLAVVLRAIYVLIVPVMAFALLALGWDLVEDERAALVHVAACLLGILLMRAMDASPSGKRRFLHAGVMILALLSALCSILLLTRSRDFEALGLALICALLVAALSKLHSRGAKQKAVPRRP